jgi:hypothetical protein
LLVGCCDIDSNCDSILGIDWAGILIMEEAKETTNSLMMLNSSGNQNNPLDIDDWLLEEIS